MNGGKGIYVGATRSLSSSRLPYTSQASGSRPSSYGFGPRLSSTWVRTLRGRLDQ